MKIYSETSKIPELKAPIVMTIGNFDGLHLGHIEIINRLKHYAKNSGTSVITTFANHPSEILTPNHKTPLLTSLEHKLHLFENYHIDITYLIHFTKELRELSYEQFIRNLRKKIPFDYLILGSDASFGKNRAGDKKNLQKLAKDHHFQVEYLPKLLSDGEIISSRRLRNCIQTGNLEEAKKLLGRPFSIYLNKGTYRLNKNSNFLEIDLMINLCLPPSGNYNSYIIIQNKQIPANIKIIKTDNDLTKIFTDLKHFQEELLNIQIVFT
ncbi:MAG: FAD synthetase family protein [Simkaniaceae bacterium]|nr:FAD synthetase family protein [Simkaniaceae bacterium]